MTRRLWLLGNKVELDLSDQVILMGILNVTPDSFSDGGDYFVSDKALKKAATMVQEGAKIIDVGGESTRPDGAPVTGEEERQRVLPIIKKLKDNNECIISIDTYRAKTAKEALESGAHIINDVCGLQNEPEMAELIAHYNAGVIIMHNSRARQTKDDVIEDQKYFFDRSLSIATKAGILEEQIVLDPGFGFGKNNKQNIELLKRAKELNSFGYPLLAATSRKRFLGYLTKQEVTSQRDVATAATSILLRQAGFSVFRVHNVTANKDALAVLEMSQ